ncbi:MAG: hypothetical protein QM611_10645, partial [Microbacterium sp.]
MNTTTSTALDIRISAFAAAVRRELGDLPVEEVDDLVDGLEADLADQAADAGDGFELPEPVAYASELRSAAGLPERSDAASARVPLRERVARARAAASARLRSSR